MLGKLLADPICSLFDYESWLLNGCLGWKRKGRRFWALNSFCKFGHRAV